MRKSNPLKESLGFFATSWLLALAAIVFWLVVPGATAILGSYAAAKLRGRRTGLATPS